MIMSGTFVFISNFILVSQCGFMMDDGTDIEDDIVTIPESFYTDTVQLVQVLFRHGDRSPTHGYANNIYRESDWPQGYGQLSKKGMQQELELGSFFRALYVEQLGYLREEFVRTEVYARSTAIDRALMSAYSVLAGLYPPDDGDEDYPNIGWQPIPVHSRPENEDHMLISKAPCPVAEDAELHNIESNPLIKQIMKEHSDFYEYVSIHSGEPNTWEGVGRVKDPIYCQYVSNYTLPEWVTDEILDELLYLMDAYTQFRFPDGSVYLRGGMLLKEMIEHMVNKSESKLSVPEKLFIYSAHDSTVIALMKSLGVFNNRQPPYTACVIVELLESIDSEFSVRIWYKNESYSTPYLLTLEDCDNLEQCPLDHFIDLFQASLPVDIKQECGISSNSSSTNIGTEFTKSSTIVNVILLVLILVLIIYIIVYMIRKRDKSRDSHDYSPVPTEMNELT